MRFLLMIITLASLSSHALGDEFHGMLEKYLEDATGKLGWDVDYVRRDAQGKTLFFCAATARAEDVDPYHHISIILVLERNPEKKFREIARSKFFTGVSDRNVENIEVHSERRFSIQINSHSNYGGGISVYRFASVGSIWTLAGLDDTTCNSNEKDEGVCESKTMRSANFLTGEFVKHEYVNGKRVLTKRKLLHFRIIPLADFENEYDAKFWEQ